MANHSESGHCGSRFAIEWTTEPGFLPAGSCGGKVRDTVPATPACIDVRLTNGVCSFVPCTELDALDGAIRAVGCNLPHVHWLRCLDSLPPGNTTFVATIFNTPDTATCFLSVRLLRKIDLTSDDFRVFFPPHLFERFLSPLLLNLTHTLNHGNHALERLSL